MSSMGDVFLRLSLEGTQLEVDAKRQGKKAGEAAGSAMSTGILAKIKGIDLFKGGVFAGAGAKLGNAAIGQLGNVVLAVGDFVSDANKAASDLNESMSKSKVIFGDSASAIENFGATAASSLGLSKRAAIEASATFGNIFVGLDIAQPKAAEMSKTLVSLAGDLASFNNLDPTDALEKLRSGLAGEAEPLRAVGVFLTEAKVKAKAMELGLADSHGELSEGAKILARYQLILEQTTTAQGDFARTADGLANSQRIANAELENTQAQLGAATQPAALLATQLQLNLFKGLQVVGASAGSLVDTLSKVGPAVAGIGDALLPWDTATELAAKDAAALAAATTEAARTSVFQVERASQNMADNLKPVGVAMTDVERAAAAMAIGIAAAGVSGAQSIENMKARIVAAATGVIDGAYGNITTADQLSATNAEINAQRRIIAMGGAAAGTDRATAALDRQSKALDRASAAETAHTATLTAAIDKQIAALDLSERQLSIEAQRHDLNEQLNAAQLDLGKAQGGTDAQAISDAMAKVADIQEQQAENERQLGVAAQRDKLEAQKTTIEDASKARQDELAKLKTALADQRAAMNTSGGQSVADAKARLHELFKTQADEVLALALAGHMGSKEVADALVDMHTRLTTAVGEEKAAILATIQALKDLQEQGERTIVNLPGGGSIARPVNAPGGPQARDRGGPVTRGVPFVVGEHRPEVFVPGESGSVVPSITQAMGGWTAGDQTTEITLNLDGEVVERVVSRRQANKLRH